MFGCALWLSTLTSSTQVRKIVMSSSPSTRFDGYDICGKAADELPIRRAPWNAVAVTLHVRMFCCC